MRRFCFIFFSLTLAGCTEGVPKFTDLGSEFSQPTVTDASKVYLISDLTSPSPAIDGTCDKNTQTIALRPAGRSEFDEVATQVLESGSDLDCTDGSFRLIVREMGQYMGFTLSLAEQKSLTIRTQAEDGDSAEVDVFIRYLPTIPVMAWVNAPSISTTEGAYLNLEITIAPPAVFGALVEFSTQSGSAREGDDFFGATGAISFGATDSVLSVSLPIYLDSLYENDETFVISLSRAVGGYLGDDVVLVTVAANGTPPSVVVGDASVSEGGTLVFGVSLSQLSGVDAVLNYQTYEGTATSSDFVAVTGQLTIREGQISTSLSVASVEDSGFEADETFSLSLSPVSGVSVLSPGIDDMALATIVNDDTLPQISLTGQNASEGDNVVFQISLSASASLDVVFSFLTFDGSAQTSDTDYNPSSGTRTILAGQASASVTVSTIEDSKLEGDETVLLSLSGVTGAILGGAGVVTASILNDDVPPTISVYDLSFNEGQTGQHAVSLSEISALPVVYSFVIYNNQTAAADYVLLTSSPQTLSAGVLSNQISIRALTDGLDEFNESYTVSLAVVQNVQAGDMTAVGTIFDQDSEVQIFVQDITRSEGTTSNHVVSLSGVSGKDVVFNLTSVDIGSATSGADFNSINLTNVTIPAGSTSVSFSVGLPEDVISEMTEVFQVTITSVVNAVAGRWGADISIGDNDGLPQLSVYPGSGSEGTIVYLTAFLSASSGSPVTFQWQTYDITNQALAGSDYVAVALVTATIAPGQFTVALPVSAISDTPLDENDETLLVSLSSAANANILIASALATLVDVDTEPLVFVDDAASVNEGQTLNFALTLSKISGRDVVVFYQTLDGSASAISADYTQVSSAAVTFPAGVGTLALSVETLGDGLNEFNESVSVTLTSFVHVLPGDGFATGTIIDTNADPLIYISDATVTEEQTASLVVSLSAPSGIPVVFDWATVDGSALAASGDYSSASGTLTIAQMTTQVTLSIPTLDDGINESTESFSVSLSALMNAQNGKVSGQINILDNDTQPRIFIADASPVVEGSSSFFAISLNFASGLDVSFDYQTLDDTALAPDDYSMIVPSRATIPAGQTTLGLWVGTVDDLKDDSAEFEYFYVTLSNPSQATISLSAATGEIQDNDSPPLIYIGDASGNEGQTISFLVTISALSENDIDLDLNTVNGTAIANGDYLAQSIWSAQIPAGSLSFTMNVVLNTDNIYEPSESFSVTIPVTTAGNGDLSGGGIINDTTGVPNLVVLDGSAVSEGAPSQFVVTLSHLSATDVTFNWSTSNGTARDQNTDNDFTGVIAQTRTIGAMNSSVTLSVATVDDTILESQENFSVTVFAGSANVNIIDGGAVGLINDNEPPLNIFITGDSELEGTDLVFTVSLSGTSAFNVTYDFATYDGTASVADGDFGVASGSKVLLAGTTAQTLTIASGVDTKLEIDESFTVSISNIIGASVNIIGMHDMASGVILNDDTAPLLSVYDLSLNEGESLPLMVSLTQISGLPVVFSWRTYDGSAATGTGDYTAVSNTTVTIPAGSVTSGLVWFQAIDDNLDENSETAQISLTAISGVGVGDLLANIAIQDVNPAPNIYVDDVALTEPDTVPFVVSLSQISGKDVWFNFDSVDGTAVGSGTDYGSFSSARTILAGQLAITVSGFVNAWDDLIAEGDENYQITLTGINNAGLGRVGATVLITDNEAVPSLVIYGDSKSEGTPLSFVASLSGASSGNVAFDFATSSGTAIEGVDFTGNSSRHTILAGALQVTMSVTTTGDLLFESDETLNVTLVNLTGPATLLGAGAVGTIINDDLVPDVFIYDLAFSEEGTGNFIVSLNANSGLNAVVSWQTYDNFQALAGVDYTSTSGTLTVFAGGRLGTIPVVALPADTLDESNEQFVVSLAIVTGAGVGDLSAIGTIIDNDGAPNLFVDPLSVNEGDPGVLVVSLSAPSGLNVVFDLNSLNGTAIQPGDYTTLARTMTIVAGEITMPALNVVTQEDSVYEGAEVFKITISNNTNSGLGIAHNNVTIVDDDPMPILAVFDATGTEGSTLGFVVSLSTMSAVDATFSWASYENTAQTSDSDYVATTGTGTVAAGALQATIPVVTTSDTKFESDETFYLSLSGLGGVSVLSPTALRATGTINNDDSAPLIWATSASLSEGTTGTMVVSLSQVSGLEAVFSWTTYDGVPATLSAMSGLDYMGVSNQVVTIPSETLNILVTITASGDAIDEFNENYQVSLSGLVNASIGDVTADVTVLDTNVEPSLTITDLTVDEGDSGVVFVNLNQVSGRNVLFSYQTVADTAGPADYTPIANTTVTIPAGSLSAAITVATTEDAFAEGSESFFVSLSNAMFANIADNTGLVTVTDDEGPVNIFISGDTKTEGSGLVFNVSLNVLSATNVTFNLNSYDGTALLADNDYASISGNRTILAGSLLGSFTILTVSDTKFETDETMRVSLSNVFGASVAAPGTHDIATGWIQNDDSQPLLFVEDLSFNEGDVGVFSASLSQVSGLPVIFEWSTVDGTAIEANSDYSASTSLTTVTILAGALTTPYVQVTSFADSVDEYDETFNVTLFGVTGAGVGDFSAVGTIFDQTAPPLLFVQDIATNEPSTVVLTVSLSVPSEKEVIFDINTFNQTAISAMDYSGLFATATIAPLATQATFNLVILDDFFSEGTETFGVTLSNVMNAGVGRLGAGVTINDTDPQIELSVFDAIGVEGETLSFVVSLNYPAPQDMYFTWDTFDGSAMSTDYQFVSSSLGTILQGFEAVTLSVGTNQDMDFEIDESFSLEVTGLPSYVSILDSIAIGIIRNDDCEAIGWCQVAYIKAANVDASDFFGDAVALDNETAVVGAYGEDSNETFVTNGSGASADDSSADSGAVYVFGRSSGSWVQQAYLKPSNNGAGDRFSQSALAVHNDTIVVGSYNEDSSQTFITNGPGAPGDDAATTSGAVYVFGRTNGTWYQQAYLKASNGAGGDSFGQSLAIHGDSIVVGAIAEDSNQTVVTNGSGASSNNTNTDSGAAYVFGRINGTWSQHAYLKASNNGASDNFGQSVAIQNDLVAIGAHNEDSNQTTVTHGPTASSDNSNLQSGAVYIFGKVSGTWEQQAYLKASNNGASDFFGRTLALDGETVVVGATGEGSNQTFVTNGPSASGDNSLTSAGAVYVFARSGGLWSQVAYLKPSNSGSFDMFGSRVAISGNKIVVGASGEDSIQSSVVNGSSAGMDDSSTNSGSVYVFGRENGTWSQQAFLKASNNDAADNFGSSVGIDGDSILVGAAAEDGGTPGINNSIFASDDDSTFNSGAAYVYKYRGPIQVIVKQATESFDPAYSLPVTWDIEFSRPINPATFSVMDITLDPISAPTTVTWNLINSGDNKNFKLQLTAANAYGVIKPTIAAAVVTDFDSFTNLPSSSHFDDQITWKALPSIFVTSTSATEGANLNFEVSLSEAVPFLVSYNFTTYDQTATVANSDYTPVGGVFVLPVWQRSQIVSVLTGNDSTFEPNETLAVTISNPVGAQIFNLGLDNVATGTIVNNDAAPPVLTLSGAGGSTLDGVAITSCGGGSVCSCSTPYIVNTATVFSRIVMTNGACLTTDAYTGGSAGPGNGILDIQVTGDFSISADSVISLSGRGYRGGEGLSGASQGNSTLSAGGSHGGIGGNGRDDTLAADSFGSITYPTALGGGSGLANTLSGAGGGAVQIKVDGEFYLNGRIEANGSNGSGNLIIASGGGAGGSVLIEAVTLSGAGSILVEGGSGHYANTSFNYGGGGAGGRIAVYFKESSSIDLMNPASSTLQFYVSGASPTFVGFGQNIGAPGSIYFVDVDQPHLGVLKTQTWLSTDQLTPIDQSLTLQSLIVDGFAAIDIEAGVTINTVTYSFNNNAGLKLSGILDADFASSWIDYDFYYNGGQIIGLIPGGALTVSGGMLMSDKTLTLSEFQLEPAGNLKSDRNTDSSFNRVDIKTTGPGGIRIFGMVDVSGRGRPGGGAYVGAGQSFASGMGGAAGGSYGGYGGPGTSRNPDKTNYGSIFGDLTLGAGGGNAGATKGGAGGGYVRLDAGSSTIRVGHSGNFWWGSLNADGQMGLTNTSLSQAAGSGSGGGIELVADHVNLDHGSLSARGGMITSTPTFYYGGAGGGGRVFIKAATYSVGGFNFYLDSHSSTSSMAAYDGGAGIRTYFNTLTSDVTINVENVGRQTFGETPLFDAGNTSLNLDYVYVNGGALLRLPTSHNLNLNSPNLAVVGGSVDFPSKFVIAGRWLDTLSHVDDYLVLENSSNPFGSVAPTVTIVNGGAIEARHDQVITYFNDLIVHSGGLLTHTTNKSNNLYGLNLQLNNLYLYGQIDVSGKGYAPGYGIGAGQSVFGWSSHPGGGGHGGVGGDSIMNYYFGGRSYGDVTLPVSAGSGGGYRISGAAAGGSEGFGGGRVKISANLMDLANMGMIEANGQDGMDGIGGGAGGSIALDVSGNLQGLMASSIQARGGHVWSSSAGAGGGGRIRAVTGGTLSNFNAFQVNGGTASGGFNGSAGTIYYGPAQASFKIASTTMIEPSVYNGLEVVLDRPLPFATNFILATVHPSGSQQAEMEDYGIVSPTVLINEGTTSALAIVNINDDALWEGGTFNDVFIISLASTDSTDLVLNGQRSVTVTISDNESPVQVFAVDSSINEAQTGSILVQFSHKSEAPIGLIYYTSGNATVGTDYLALTPAPSVPFQVPPLSNQYIIPVQAVENGISGAVSLNTNFMNASSPTSLTITKPLSTHFFIDNESGRINVGDAIVMEGETAQIRIEITGSLGGGGSIDLGFGGFSYLYGASGADHGSPNPVSALMSRSGPNAVFINVPIFEDAVSETTELMTFPLQCFTGCTNFAMVLSKGVGRITILDRPNVSFQNNFYSFSESATNAAIVLQTSSHPGRAIDFTLSLVPNGKAIAGKDYILPQLTGQIPINTSSFTIPIQLINDLGFEFNEEFVFSLSSVTNAKLGNFGLVTIRITDDDPLIVEPQYPINGRKWNDYVKRNGTEWHNATDAACAPILDSGGGGYRNCQHGGEHKVVRTGLDSCSGLNFSDNLSALDWQCDDNNGLGPVNFYSYKLNNDKGLRDLITGSGSSFEFAWMQFNVNRPADAQSGWSASSKWWSNQVIALDSSAKCLDIKEEGGIYITDQPISCQAVIEADRVAVVTKGPNGTLRFDSSGPPRCPGHVFSSNATCVLSSYDTRVGESYDFLWIETDIEADMTLGSGGGDAAWNALHLRGSRFTVIRNSRMVGSLEANINLVELRNSWVENVFVAYQQSGTASGLGSISRGGVTLNGTNYSTFYQLKSTNNIFRGLNFMNSPQENLFNKVIVDGSESYGLDKAGTRNTFKDMNVTNVKDGAFNITGSANNTLTNLFISNAGTFGLSFTSSSSSNKVANLNMTNVASYNVTLGSTATNNTFFGDINFDDALCSYDPSNPSPGVLTNCGQGGSSSYILSTTLNTSTSFVDLVTIDSQNTFENISGQSSFSWLTSLGAWLDFETPFRVWSLPHSINSSLAQGSCTSGTCQIRDLSLKPNDTILQNIYPQVVGGANCPAEWNGASPSQGNIISDQRTPANTFFIKADEILGDGEGDDDGLCESGEDCVQHRSFGLFQGETDTDLTSKCNFNDGVITDVKMFARVSYATFDPGQVGPGWSLVNNDTRANRIAGVAGNSRAQSPKNSGKYYFEYLVHSSVTTAAGVVGLADSSIAIGSNASGAPNTVLLGMNGQIRVDTGTFANYWTSAIIGGNVIGFAVDLDARLVWISVNGLFYNGSTWTATEPQVGQGFSYGAGPTSMVPIVSASSIDSVSQFTFRSSPASIQGRPPGFTIGWPK